MSKRNILSPRARHPAKYRKPVMLVCAIVLAATLVDWDLFFRYVPRLISGAGTTLLLTFGGIAGGMVIAVPSALSVFFGGRALRAAFFMYSYIIRGTPLLLQLFLVYYGSAALRPQLEMIGLWGAFREPFYAAIVVFIVNSSAYQIEIFHGAISSIPKSQWSAAAALGLTRLQAFRLIVAPQAARIALRPLGNEVIFVFKASAIASVITVYDLMGETRVAYSRSYDFEVYLYAAVMYLVVVEAIRRVWDIADRRLSRSLSPG